MNSIKTTGIVLKGTNFGEADKILTIFTERLGKIKIMAKGIRKIKSHLAGALEPFMLVDLQLHEGKTFYIVTGASIVADFPNLRGDLQRTAKAFLLGEMIDQFIQENQKLVGAFELFVDTLRSLDQGSDKPSQIRAFELKIIEAAGFKPELHECVHCKKKIEAGENFWDMTEGGVICAQCERSFSHGWPISDDVIKTLRFLEKSDFDKIRLLKIDDAIDQEVEKILTVYIDNILEKELKSRKFLKEIG